MRRTTSATSAPPNSSRLRRASGIPGRTTPTSWTRRRGCSSIPNKLHLLHHKGKHFQVRGPLMVPRSPQGQPVIVQAGQSEAGLELAARTAEVLFTVSQNLETSKKFYTDLKARTAKCGRSPDSIKIMPGVLTVVGKTRDEAKEKFERLQALIHPELGVAMLSDIVGLDLSKYPLDGPMPDVPLTNSQQGRQKVVMDMARRGEPDDPPALHAGRRRARGHRVVHRHRGRYRRCAGGMVSRRRGRRLQHHAAGAAGGLERVRRARHSGIAAARVVPKRSTKARRCARTSACRVPPTASRRRPPRPSNVQAEPLGRSNSVTLRCALTRSARASKGDAAPASPNPGARFILRGSLRSHLRMTGERARLLQRSNDASLHLDDDVVLLDRHRKRLGDVRPLHQRLAGLDRDLKLPRPRRFRIAPRLPGADVELPAVPRAAQEFADVASSR